MSESPGGPEASALANGSGTDLAPGQPAEDWRPLADRIAGNARDFLDGLTAVARGEGADETVPLLLLEAAQMMLAGAQLGASKDVILPNNWEPDVGADPDMDLDALRTGLAARLTGFDDYAEIFDPFADTQATPFRLSDDLAAPLGYASRGSAARPALGGCARPAGRCRGTGAALAGLRLDRLGVRPVAGQTVLAGGAGRRLAPS